MMKRLNIVAAGLLLFGSVSSAQAQETEQQPPQGGWLETTHDFGSFAEADGPVSGNFQMVNRFGVPVSILRVKTSCGCTQADFPKGEIAPGDTATITFSYDPTGRPGQFAKTIKVWFNPFEGQTGTEPDVLHILGNVIANPETLKALYPIEVGDLRISTRIVDLGELKNGVSRHGYAEVYNQSTDSVTPVVVSGHPALEAAAVPKTIAPGQAGILSLYLNSADLDEEPGPVSLPVELVCPMEGGGVKTTVSVFAELLPLRGAVIAPETTREKADKENKKQKRFGKTYTEAKETKEPKEKEDKEGKHEGKKKGKRFGNSYTEEKHIETEEEKAYREAVSNKPFSNVYREKRK